VELQAARRITRADGGAGMSAGANAVPLLAIATGLATTPSLGVLAALAVAGAALVVALSLAMRGHPWLFPLLAVAAVPFRLPISADGRTVNLLIPLYVVVGAGTLAHVLPRVLGSEQRGRERWRPIALDWVLLAAVAVYAVQATYSADATKALENVAFFYVPFGLLYVGLREVRWSGGLLGRCLAVAVAEAVVFAGVGFVEYQRKALLLNPKVVAANQYDNYFRVNSLFFDPSIYGRFLALVMICVTCAVLTIGMRASSGTRADAGAARAAGPPGTGGGPGAADDAGRARRDVVIGGVVLLWLLGGLVTSFSQSSIAALLVGLAVLAAWRWDVRATLYVCAAALALAGVVAALAPASLHLGLKGRGGSASNATSGRAKLVEGGLELFAQRPLWGYGSGSFETQYKRRSGASTENATSASHTIPVTVAAEQGIVGLGLYAALLVAAFATLFAGIARSPRGRSPPRIALAAAFAALVVHTWTYADFLEDPLTWTLLGIGVALALAPSSV